MNHNHQKRSYAQWTAEERYKVFDYVEKCAGKPNWQELAFIVTTKTKRQCYDFYYQNKDNSKGFTVRHKWTKAEEQVIIEFVRKSGFNAEMIKAQLPDLSFHQIKNRYYNLVKRRYICDTKNELSTPSAVDELVRAVQEYCRYSAFTR